MTSVAVFSPAKVNLSLLILGKREDGFHNLFSLAAPVQFGDSLWIQARDEEEDLLECNHSELPCDRSNLILKAVDHFRSATGLNSHFRIRLQKRIPLQSGLGGGSSNAIATLNGLQQLSGCRLSREQFHAIASKLGSDCPLFLMRGPVVFEGRGEQVTAVKPTLWERLKNYHLLLVTPGYGIPTGWAFRNQKHLQNGPGRLQSARESLASFEAGKVELKALLQNDFEPLVLRKYLAFAEARDYLTRELDLPCLLSGSGSSFFCLSQDRDQLFQAGTWVREALGSSISCVETRFSSP